MKVRLEKFTSLIKAKLAAILFEYQTASTTVTITNIQISPDFKFAKVWLSVFGVDSDRISQAIIGDTAQISKNLAATLRTKFSPKLQFNINNDTDYMGKIEKLLAG